MLYLGIFYGLANLQKFSIWEFSTYMISYSLLNRTLFFIIIIIFFFGFLFCVVILLKGESFCPGTKISSNYKDHAFGVFIYKYQQTAQLTGI